METVYTNWRLEPKDRKPLHLNAKMYWDKEPRVCAIIQAHTKSVRFPNKIYAQLAGAPMLWHTINRVRLASFITSTVVVSPEELDLPDGVPLFLSKGIQAKDVLSEYHACATHYEPEYVVRITSDCPVIDPGLIEFVVQQAIIRKADYCSNVLSQSFPDGQDIEVLSFRLLNNLNNHVHSDSNREHVTLAIRRSLTMQKIYKCVSIINDVDYSDIKISVDKEEDLKRIEEMGLV